MPVSAVLGVTGRRSRPSARRVRSRRLPLAGALLREAGLDRDDVRAVAAGIPGPLDRQRRVISSPILSSRTGFADELAGCLGKPIDIGSDADTGAIGEKRLGAAREYAIFFYMKVSHGAGSGVVIDSRCYRGGRGVTGQLGHTHLPGVLNRCRCANQGCLEAVVSVPAVRDQLAGTHLRAGASGAEPSLAAAARDPAGARAVAAAGRTAGRVAADGCCWLDPEAIILGGELGISGPPFAEEFCESPDRYAQPAPAHAVVMDIAGLGSRSEVMGTIAVAIDRCAAP